MPDDSKSAPKPGSEATKSPQSPRSARRRDSSAVIPRKIVYITPGETTCKDCPCFPYEEPYEKNKKLNRCQKTPLPLYILCARLVDLLPMPVAFQWDVDQVVDWMSNTVGFPQYEECIRDNNVNGRRLLLLEDPSTLPRINIHYHIDIQKITYHIRQLFRTEFIWFTRSVGLPPRYPFTHVVQYKSRTGPSYGCRQNMKATDILRCMKILMPEPFDMNHWDWVWYIAPDMPKVKVARVPTRPRRIRQKKEACQEYLMSRKFRIMMHLRNEDQTIWLQHRSGSAIQLVDDAPKKKKRPQKPKRPTTGNLMLDRRKRPKPKFLA